MKKSRLRSDPYPFTEQKRTKAAHQWPLRKTNWPFKPSIELTLAVLSPPDPGMYKVNERYEQLPG